MSNLKAPFPVVLATLHRGKDVGGVEVKHWIWETPFFFVAGYAVDDISDWSWGVTVRLFYISLHLGPLSLEGGYDY